jgi:excisionase family DNA binding protein
MNEIEKMTFSREEAAQYLGIHLNTLDKSDIPYVKIGRRVLYRRVTLEKLLEEGEKKWKSKRKG